MRMNVYRRFKRSDKCGQNELMWKIDSIVESLW